MATVFLVCALLGGSVLVLQFVLGLIGLGLESFDIHIGAGDHAHVSDAFNLLSARSIAAALAFFGIGGLLMLSLGLGGLVALPVGLLAGTGAAVGTAALMRTFTLLESDGTVQLERALGQPGTVYLPIPGHNAGAGKVQLTVQNRTIECQAVTALDHLPTGTPIIVVDIVGPDTVEVAPAPTLGGLLDASS